MSHPKISRQKMSKKMLVPGRAADRRKRLSRHGSARRDAAFLRVMLQS
jgi:hypothetical protein